MIYLYRIERGAAWLNRGDDKPLKKIGKFADDLKAKAACESHHAKACRMADAANRTRPQIGFF